MKIGRTAISATLAFALVACGSDTPAPPTFGTPTPTPPVSGCTLAQQLTFAFDRTMDVKIEEARVNGGDYFRVLIGPFASMEAAEVQRAALARAGIADGFLTRR